MHQKPGAAPQDLNGEYSLIRGPEEHCWNFSTIPPEAKSESHTSFLLSMDAEILTLTVGFFFLQHLQASAPPVATSERGPSSVVFYFPTLMYTLTCTPCPNSHLEILLPCFMYTLNTLFLSCKSRSLFVLPPFSWLS